MTEYLGLFNVTDGGNCIDVPYDVIKARIEGYTLGVSGSDIVSQLVSDGYVEVSPTGGRILTEKGMAIYKPFVPIIKEVTKKNDPRAWDRFRALCGYYKDCVHQSGRSYESLFVDQFNNRFMALQVLEYDTWLNPSCEELTWQIPNDASPALNLMVQMNQEENDVYIGYPLLGCTSAKGNHYYTPLFLIPVELIFRKHSKYLKIDYEGIDINRGWLEYSMNRSLIREMLSSISYFEGERRGCVNIELGLKYLSNKYKVDLDWKHLDHFLKEEKQGIVNRAVIFVGGESNYTKKLEKELHYISGLPSSVLDQTALAYVFRDPPLEILKRGDGVVPAPFIKTNYEQWQAIQEGLNHSLTKVAGPPGTGKSQVAVNLIANLVYNKRSVLFTSKNHKAIHAIDEKLHDVLPNCPFMKMCSDTQGSVQNTWDKVDYDEQDGELSRFLEAYRLSLVGGSSVNLEQIEEIQAQWRESNQNREDYRDLTIKLGDVHGKLLGLEAMLSTFTELKTNKEKAKHLETLLEQVEKAQQSISWWKKIWRKMRGVKKENLEETLRMAVPSVSAALSTEQLIERVQRLCTNLNEYFLMLKKKQELEGKTSKLPNYDEILKIGHELLDRFNQHAKLALIARYVASFREVDPSAIDDMKLYNRRLQKRHNIGVLDEKIETLHAEGQAIFSAYSQAFPAWMTTLLSLNRASPCIAGAFDHVIIDEASQCDIPPMIPALFRAKSATIIGDSKQFKPVITLPSLRNEYLRDEKAKLSGIADTKLDYAISSAYAVTHASVRLLKDHFRCVPGIIAYSNEIFYNNELEARKDIGEKEQKKLAEIGRVSKKRRALREGIQWEDVKDSQQGEIDRAVELLEMFSDMDGTVSIGVISPLRKIVERIQSKIATNKAINISGFDYKVDVNTSNGFQGGERDVIIFVLGDTSELHQSQRWYIESKENRSIYNVSISRARLCVIVVGDSDRALRSPAEWIRKLANPPKPRVSKSDSIGEETLYKALCKAGLSPVQQYPIAGRYLDMALVEQKIDIEVDGVAYHTTRTGARKADDIFRDEQLCALNWQVKRFWHHEVMNETERCVQEIRNML